MIQPVGIRVALKGEDGAVVAYGVVTGHEPASRIGDHSRHVLRLENGSLVSTDADLIQSAEEAAPIGTVELEEPREIDAGPPAE